MRSNEYLSSILLSINNFIHCHINPLLHVLRRRVLTCALLIWMLFQTFDHFGHLFSYKISYNHVSQLSLSQPEKREAIHEHFKSSEPVSVRPLVSTVIQLLCKFFHVVRISPSLTAILLGQCDARAKI